MCPHRLSSLLGIVSEDCDSVLVFLKEIIHQSKKILNGLILGNVSKEIVECLGALHRILLDHPLPVLLISTVKPGDEGEVILGHHLRPNLVSKIIKNEIQTKENSLEIGLPIDGVCSDLSRLLLKNAGSCDIIITLVTRNKTLAT